MIWTSFPSCLKSCLSLLALNSISFKLHHHLEDPSKQDRSDHATTAGHLLYVVYCDERVPIDLHRTLPYIKSFDRAYLGRMACRKLHCQYYLQEILVTTACKLQRRKVRIHRIFYTSAGTTTLPGIPLSKALSLAAGMT